MNTPGMYKIQIKKTLNGELNYGEIEDDSTDTVYIDGKGREYQRINKRKHHHHKKNKNNNPIQKN